MIKFVRQKSRDNSVQTTSTSKSFLKKKGESNDSGTESDGDVLDVDKQRHIDLDMETSLSSCADATNSPTDTACSSESSAAMLCQAQHLLYDQHSSEEELEVINGPSSVAAAEAAASILVVRGGTASSLISSERGSSSLEPEELFSRGSVSVDCGSTGGGSGGGGGAECGTSTAAGCSKRASSTLMVENRKRSLAHSSDDELRNFLEPILTPVNFRTSPPLEAFKPNRSHMYRSTTPLILSEARSGIENISLCDNSVNDENGDINNSGDASMHTDDNATTGIVGGGGGSSGGGGVSADSDANVIKVCGTALKMSRSSHHIYQPQPKYNLHYNSSRSSPASTTGLSDMEVRSVSPPAKLFHCAISPRRRPMRTSANAATGTASGAAAVSTSSAISASTASTVGVTATAGATSAAAVTTHQHHHSTAATQRLQRPHRPCLDFDKMQQVSL